VADLCLEESVEMFMPFLVWILPLSPADPQCEEGTRGLCFCSGQGGSVTDGTDFLQDQIQTLTVFILLLEDGTRCSSVRLLGCCFQSADSIHINVALLHTVIYAGFVTPGTRTRVCKDIKCYENPAADYCLTKSAF